MRAVLHEHRRARVDALHVLTEVDRDAPQGGRGRLGEHAHDGARGLGALLDREGVSVEEAAQQLQVRAVSDRQPEEARGRVEGGEGGAQRRRVEVARRGQPVAEVEHRRARPACDELTRVAQAAPEIGRAAEVHARDALEQRLAVLLGCRDESFGRAVGGVRRDVGQPDGHAVRGRDLPEHRLHHRPRDLEILGVRLARDVEQHHQLERRRLPLVVLLDDRLGRHVEEHVALLPLRHGPAALLGRRAHHVGAHLIVRRRLLVVEVEVEVRARPEVALAQHDPLVVDGGAHARAQPADGGARGVHLQDELTEERGLALHLHRVDVGARVGAPVQPLRVAQADAHRRAGRDRVDARAQPVRAVVGELRALHLVAHPAELVARAHAHRVDHRLLEAAPLVDGEGLHDRAAGQADHPLALERVAPRVEEGLRDVGGREVAAERDGHLVRAPFWSVRRPASTPRCVARG